MSLACGRQPRIWGKYTSTGEETMKKTLKIICLALAAILLVSLIPLRPTAYAEETGPDAGTAESGAVEIAAEEDAAEEPQPEDAEPVPETSADSAAADAEPEPEPEPEPEQPEEAPSVSESAEEMPLPGETALPEEIPADADAVIVTAVELSLESPRCGSVIDGESSLAEDDLYTEAYAGAVAVYDAFRFEKCLWVIEDEAGEYVPFRGTILGGESYTAYIVLQAEAGYSFAEDIDVSSYSDMTILLQEGDTIAVVVTETARHDTDWDTYTYESATCLTPSREAYLCLGCGELFETVGEINENAHVWSDWTVLQEATTTRKGSAYHTCTLCGVETTAEIPMLYAAVYEPDTSWSMAATIAWRADANALQTAKADRRPATAFVWLDADLRVYDRDGGLLSDSVAAYVEATSATVIPAFYIRDAATAAALKSWLAQTGFEDCFVVSTPENKALVKDVADLLHVRGMLDFSAVSSPDRRELTQMVSAVNGAHGKVVLLSAEAATRENIQLLQSLCATVWVQAPTDTRTLATLYTNGVNGVLVDDYEAAIRVEELFQDDAPTLLRIPRIIGHRGDPSNYPENTLESARGAYQEGADAIENDIQLTSDGEVFIRHDSSLLRFIGAGNVYGSDLTLAELRAMTFSWDDESIGIPVTNEVSNSDPSYGALFGGRLYGESEGMTYRTPTLREYLAEFKGKDVVHDTEIKTSDTAIIPAFKQLVDEYDAWDQVFTITFEQSILEAVYANWPEISIGALAAYPMESEYYSSGSFADLEQEACAEVALEALYAVLDQWNATYNPGYYGYGESTVQAGRHRGLTVWPWTYTTADISSFARDYLLGVSGMTVDEPWIASDFIVEISSEDVTEGSTEDIAKPVGRTKTGEERTLQSAELVTLEALNDAGTEQLMIWRYRASLDVNGVSYGSYYLYSNPFVVTSSAAAPTAEPTATPAATPTAEPTATPAATPTAEPTATPAATTTAQPTATPINEPTAQPTATPAGTASRTPATRDATDAVFPAVLLAVCLAGLAGIVPASRKKRRR